MKETGYIFDIKRYSINDGPGIRTTVFFKGCPLDCLWCHNPESRHLKPEKIEASDRWGYYSWSCAKDIIGKEVTPPEIFEEIRKDIPFYNESGGGVTFSGGEPLMQPEFLFKLLKMCKDSSIHTAVDTSGYASKEIFDRIYDYTDIFLFDLKLASEEEHKKYTGVSNKLILNNLKKLTARGNKVIIRIPIIPAINDDTLNIQSTIKIIESLDNVLSINLLPYHNSAQGKYKKLDKEYILRDTQLPSGEMMTGISERFRSAGFTVSIGG